MLNMRCFSGFIRHVVSFLCLGLMLYVLASIYQYFSKDDIIKHTVKCRYCKKRVSAKVSTDQPSRFH